ncbi:hypothetical protein SAMN05216167_12384 [Spirosoma endophyticum]|uniref:Uncharacterized protein n=1 Tax=Spirosoma endophyticum TaxID=662367 RepID=A0A1I2EYP4_9BACT|nr:hypothetical protein SAMN05216167_12384 [Spirosoma endophyticum]
METYEFCLAYLSIFLNKTSKQDVFLYNETTLLRVLSKKGQIRRAFGTGVVDHSAPDRNLTISHRDSLTTSRRHTDAPLPKAVFMLNLLTICQTFY